MVTIKLCKYRYKKSSYYLVTAFFCGWKSRSCLTPEGKFY